MSLQVVHSTEAPCCLERGHVRRVPIAKVRPLLAYHVCCPLCGMTNTTLQGHEGNLLNEDNQGRLSVSLPITCMMCRSVFSIDHDTLTFKELPGG